ncbi:uncharacterized protein LOC106766221 [Vigna radiata var. radiata]|uniref:Uncharacterized protein LOC106766221 n=1 Tax=Vigna radiata var. radiata TaxID=3916 RepID=A0A1S3UK89_VIGRR|nr:uncharacterized protein LOC106766221 [Vigna radiata var. radiata]
MANFKAAGVILEELNWQQKKKLLHDVKQFIWDDLYLFKIGVDNLLRRCVLKHYGVIHKVVSPYHPQTNGQAEVSNSEIKRILEKTVAVSRKNWAHKLDDALWAYRTVMKTSMGLSPFQLVYGKACHLLVEMEHKALWALKFLNFDPHETQSKRRSQLLELEEMQLHAYDSSRSYKEKLKSKWSGPFVIKHVHPHGGVELVNPVASDLQKSWVVNGQRLKYYLGGEVEQLSPVMKLVDP